MHHDDHATRRRFLTVAGAAAAFAAVPGLGAQSVPAPERKQWKPTPPWFRLSLAEWSLHRTINGGYLDHLKFAETARIEYGVDAVEYVNGFFKDKGRDQAYLAEMKKNADGAGVKSLLIMVDGEGAIGDPDEAKRIQAVENHKQWVDAAAFLGCHSVRVNAHSAGFRDEQRKLAADGLRRLVEYADPKGINVLVENHGGLSSDGAWLASVMKTVDHPRCGTLPDFGNFKVSTETTYDRYRGVTELMPFAKAVSAKSYEFDRAGNETTIDYRRMLTIVRDAGYRGYIGIEYEGKVRTEKEGVRLTQKLLRILRRELAPA